VKRAVASVTTGDASAPASKVRTAARSLLARDSESLSERNFTRILHDAHDADLIDLRRRGNDYEVAQAVAAAPVDKQLADAATANAPAPKPVPAVQRGMGARGIGRGPMGKKDGPPLNLLLLGVVAPKAAPVSAAPTNTAKPTADEDAVAAVEESLTAKPARGRKRSPAAKKAPKKEAASKSAPATSADAEAKPAAKRGRTPRKKTAAKTTAGADKS
jgi:hypothetical protein